MATIVKRQGKRGVRWLARVRMRRRESTRTFTTKAQAESWARGAEISIEGGQHVATRPGDATLFADVIDSFIEHRKSIRRPPGATLANELRRLREWYGMEPLTSLDVAFWRKHALKRLKQGIGGATIAGDLAYAGSVLKHAQREAQPVDSSATGKAREMLREDGVRVVSRERTRRLTDDELKKLFKSIRAFEPRTTIPLGDLIEFALATGMRRGEVPYSASCCLVPPKANRMGQNRIMPTVAIALSFDEASSNRPPSSWTRT